MRTGFWTWTFGTVISAAAIVAAAQTTPRSQGTPSRGTSRFTVIGCVQRATSSAGGASDARFTITDTRGDTPTTYRLTGEESQLDLHVGHTMEITGTLSDESSKSPVLKAESMVWIASHCSK